MSNSRRRNVLDVHDVAAIPSESSQVRRRIYCTREWKSDGLGLWADVESEDVRLS
jgi:hypothetical protein